MNKIKLFLKNEEGFTTPEVLVTGAILAALAVGVFTLVRTPANTASSIIGNKLTNATSADIPTW